MISSSSSSATPLPSPEAIQERVRQMQDFFSHTIPQEWGPILAKFDPEFQKQTEILIYDIVRLYVQIEYAKQLQACGVYPQDYLSLLQIQAYKDKSAELLRWTRLHGHRS